MATLNFKGKTFVQNHHLAVKYHQLVPKKDKSLTDKVSLSDNLILHGDNLKALKAFLPTLFYTATGEEFDPKKINESRNFIGESKEYEVYLFYKPDMEYLKQTALTLDMVKGLGHYKGKKRLVFAPSKYLDTDYLLEYRVDYCQLPFEIYKLKE